MAKNITGNLAFAGYSDIFKSTTKRADGECIVEIPLEEFYPPDYHLFHVFDDESMTRLSENTKRYGGVHEPAVNVKNIKKARGKIMKKFLFLLVLPMLFAAACADNNSGTETDEPVTAGYIINEPEISSEPEIIHDNLPDDLNLDGAVINLLVQSDEWKAREFVALEEIGEVVNDAVYRRNIAVEERLNVNLNVIEGPGWEQWDAMARQIRNSVTAGDNSYDLIAGWSGRVPTLALEDLFLNLFELPHVDMEKPWWNQSMKRELTLGGSLYFLAGDMTLSMIENCSVFYFNKVIHRDLALPDLYQAVLDGVWTLDYMFNLTKDIYSDVNGNGIADDGDLFGVILYPLNVADGFMQASDIRMITSDSAGMPELNIEHEKLSALVDKVYGLYYENPGAQVVAQNEQLTAPFRNNLILLKPATLSGAIGLRDMESDYGIVPYPKFDEMQENYLTRVWDALSIMCVPVNADKTEEIGAFMEAMAFESYQNLTPAYFDIALKGKYTRDDASSQMLDIVRDGAYMNFASIYNESIGSPWHMMRTLMNTQSNNFASWYERNEGAVTRALENLIDRVK